MWGPSNRLDGDGRGSCSRPLFLSSRQCFLISYRIWWPGVDYNYNDEDTRTVRYYAPIENFSIKRIYFMINGKKKKKKTRRRYKRNYWKIDRRTRWQETLLIYIIKYMCNGKSFFFSIPFWTKSKCICIICCLLGVYYSKCICILIMFAIEIKACNCNNKIYITTVINDMVAHWPVIPI